MIENQNEHSDTDDNMQGLFSEQILSSDPTEQANNTRKVEPTSKKSLRSSQKVSSQSSPRHKSAKNSLSSLKNREEIDALSKETSQQVIKSVYSLISSKFPFTLGKSELSNKDQFEIQNFFLKKKNEFNKVLEEISLLHQQTPKKKIKKAMKYHEYNEKKYIKELARMHEQQKILKKQLIQRASEKILKEKKVIKKQKELEAKRREREERKMQEQEKVLIIENIENFYRDRIMIVRDFLKKEIESKKIIEYDEKQYVSSLIKQKKQNRMKNLCDLKHKYEMKIEELKDKFSSM